jgi:hypothetical protein
MILTKEKIAKDKILSEGFGYRRWAWAIFPVGVLTAVLVRLNDPWISVGALAINLVGYSFIIRFKLWEKRNAEYIRSLGFDVKA